MTSFIELTVNDITIPIEYSQFPAGEEYVKILDTTLIKNNALFSLIVYDAGSTTIMQSILVADAVKQINNDAVILAYFPYIPYGRQDRVCSPGESFSLEVFNDLMKTRVDGIFSYDMHSAVSEKLFFTLGAPEEYISLLTKEAALLAKHIPADTLFVSPDKGAINRTKAMTNNSIAILDKTRVDGRITQTASEESVELIKQATHITIPDDICDGGGTFLAAADFIKTINPDVKLLLIISHGIFSKGTDTLLKVFEDIIVPLDPYNVEHLYTNK